MILDRDGLTLLLSLSSKVEGVTEEAIQTKDSLSKPGEVRTPEDGYLEYPEEAVLQVREELSRRGKL